MKLQLLTCALVLMLLLSGCESSDMCVRDNMARVENRTALSIYTREPLTFEQAKEVCGVK